MHLNFCYGENRIKSTSKTNARAPFVFTNNGSGAVIAQKGYSNKINAQFDPGVRV